MWSHATRLLRHKVIDRAQTALAVSCRLSEQLSWQNFKWKKERCGQLKLTTTCSAVTGPFWWPDVRGILPPAFPCCHVIAVYWVQLQGRRVFCIIFMWKFDIWCGFQFQKRVNLICVYTCTFPVMSCCGYKRYGCQLWSCLSVLKRALLEHPFRSYFVKAIV